MKALAPMRSLLSLRSHPDGLVFAVSLLSLAVTIGATVLG